MSRYFDDSITHHGVKGMKWGVRRYQNDDGSLTEAGKKRYYDIDKFGTHTLNKRGKKHNKKQSKKAGKIADRLYKDFKNSKKLKSLRDELKSMDSRDSETFNKEINRLASDKKNRNLTWNDLKDQARINYSNSSEGKRRSQIYKTIEKEMRKAINEKDIKDFNQLSEYGYTPRSTQVAAKDYIIREAMKKVRRGG